MPTENPSYSSLVVQPIDLVRAFRIDYCFASVIKELTKWQIDHKIEHITTARYYTRLCNDTPRSNELLFTLRLYCLSNGFISDGNRSCLLLDVTTNILDGNINSAIKSLNSVG